MEKSPSSNSWSTFGSGPRSCIGKNFAITEITLLLVRILCKFTFEADIKSIETSRFSPALKPKDKNFKIKIMRRI